ncbi:hypothetical protein AUR04nite_16980 [Glutamicibacter uratoxydans]|uniref:Uncharacterized protein n=1 Tax=Glutamicibacter uratoxydans TaxID=43667 RepID=A0A4Y4DMK1_GLUUR|nr:hypothetical protein [Glutamicibacter uratoxydans]GED06166.1 hypothetical protein AUR04nite_16980 [Glutamicibacter uratoxydans]
MASKKRQSKKNSGPGNPAKAAPRGRSVHRIQAEQAVDALRDQYVRWVAAQVPGFSTADAAQASEIQLEVVQAVVGDYAEAARSSQIFKIDAEIFGESLAQFLVTLPDEVAPEPIFTTWLDFLSFVEEHELWEGDQESFEELREMLEDALEGFAEGDAEICELLRGTALFPRVKSFALALEDGIDVTDFSEASNEPRARVLAAMGVESSDPDAPAPLEFNYIWNAAMMSVVVSDGDKIVRDEEAFAAFLEGEDAASAQILFEMAVGAVQGHLNPTMDDTLRDEAHYLVLRNLLVTASTGREGDVEGLRRNIGPKIYDQVLPEAQAAMASLASFGLLELNDGVYSIDERLAPVISAGISEVEAFFEDAE